MTFSALETGFYVLMLLVHIVPQLVTLDPCLSLALNSMVFQNVAPLGHPSVPQVLVRT